MMTSKIEKLVYSAWLIHRESGTCSLLYTYENQADADACSEAYCRANDLDPDYWLRKTIVHVVRPAFDESKHKTAMALAPGTVGDHSHL